MTCSKCGRPIKVTDTFAGHEYATWHDVCPVTPDTDEQNKPHVLSESESALYGEITAVVMNQSLSNVRKAGQLMSVFTRHLRTLQAKHERELVDARIEEALNMPHQYDPGLELHTMSDERIPRPVECRCYKGRRITDLESQRAEIEHNEPK